MNSYICAIHKYLECPKSLRPTYTAQPAAQNPANLIILYTYVCRLLLLHSKTADPTIWNYTFFLKPLIIPTLDQKGQSAQSFFHFWPTFPPAVYYPWYMYWIRYIIIMAPTCVIFIEPDSQIQYLWLYTNSLLSFVIFSL